MSQGRPASVMPRSSDRDFAAFAYLLPHYHENENLEVKQKINKQWHGSLSFLLEQSRTPVCSYVPACSHSPFLCLSTGMTSIAVLMTALLTGSIMPATNASFHDILYEYNIQPGTQLHRGFDDNFHVTESHGRKFFRIRRNIGKRICNND